MNHRVFILLAVAMLAGSVMAQGHHNDRPRHNDKHHHTPVEHRYNDCATREQMRVVMDALNAQSFDDKKLEIANLCVTIGHFCTDDLAQMATVFSFDDRRLAFLKYAYPYCVDKENYPGLRDSFTFKSNYDALIDFIYPNMR